MRDFKKRIIYENEDFIVVVKKSGEPTQPDKTGDISLADLVGESIGGSVFLINRLDRPVGGVVVFAKNTNSASIISKQIQNNEFEKYYLAILVNEIVKKEDRLINFLKKNTRTNLSEVVNEKEIGAKEAVLDYKVLASSIVGNDIFNLVKIRLETGRHHQIRVQTAFMGNPVLGDRKYNNDFKHSGNSGICLWSYKLFFINPKDRRRMEFSVLPDLELFSLFKDILGGETGEIDFKLY